MAEVTVEGVYRYKDPDNGQVWAEGDSQVSLTLAKLIRKAGGVRETTPDGMIVGRGQDQDPAGYVAALAVLLDSVYGCLVAIRGEPISKWPHPSEALRSMTAELEELLTGMDTAIAVTTLLYTLPTVEKPA